MKIRSRKQRSSGVGLFGMGFELAAAVGGFALVGYWIGGHYDNAKLGLLIGAVLGIVGGMYNLVRASMAASRRAERQGRGDGTRHS